VGSVVFNADLPYPALARKTVADYLSSCTRRHAGESVALNAVTVGLPRVTISVEHDGFRSGEIYWSV
jgi:hypothetical protein